jgi:hypothetical protein
VLDLSCSEKDSKVMVELMLGRNGGAPVELELSHVFVARLCCSPKQSWWLVRGSELGI